MCLRLHVFYIKWLKVIIVDKEKIRKEILQKRLELPKETVNSLSMLICEHIIEMPSFLKCKYILIYHPIKNEVDCSILFEKLLKMDKIICLPRMSGNSLEVVPVKDVTVDTAAGKFGVKEPIAGLPSIDPSFVELALIPGVAFDRSGNRMGYGKGYYDQLLPTLSPVCKKIGLAFNMQVIDNLPVESHDQKIEGLITESGCFSFNSK